MSALYAYSLIKSFHDEQKDYIDAFIPLVVRSIPAEGVLSLQVLQEKIQSHYSFSVPVHSLVIILRRASQRGLCELTKGATVVTLNPAGKIYSSNLEPERATERRLHELIADAATFLSTSTRSEVSSGTAQAYLTEFIERNLTGLEAFLLVGAEYDPGKIERPGTSHIVDSALFDYCLHVEREKPAIFQTLHDVICGSVLSLVVHSNLLEESNKMFGKTLVFLDSNFLLGVLGLRHDEENRPALELFSLMQDEGVFDFQVFDFTIAEITNLLRNYQREQHQYLKYFRVGSIFSSLKAKGWTPANVLDFIANIEKRLAEINVSTFLTDISLRNFEPTDKKLGESLRRYKPDQGAKERSHDLAAIETVRKLRGKRPRRIEACEAMLLTSDLKLSSFNYIEQDHKDLGTIAEVIPDRLLTTLLWLKNPTLSARISLVSLISLHSRSDIIDQQLWVRFRETLDQLRREGSIKEKEVSILLLDRHLQDIFKSVDPEDGNELSEKILDNLETFRREVPASEALAVIPADISQVHVLEDRLGRLNEAINAMAISRIESSKARVEREANRMSGWLMGSFLALILLLEGLALPSCVRFVTEKWSLLEPEVWVIGIALTFTFTLLGFRFDPGKLRQNLKQRIKDSIYRRKIQAVNLSAEILTELRAALDEQSPVSILE
ncbi:MAG: hypothetical protein ABJC13_25240 [Acidobacteriota bacterium]